MAYVYDLTKQVTGLVPQVSGWPLYVQVEPLADALPPWVIVTATNRGVYRGEAGFVLAGMFRMELRCVSDNTDAVNVWCDDHAIPALQGVVPSCEGFQCSCLSLSEDSGAYASGLVDGDTSYRYRIRVLRFDMTWSRNSG